MGVLAENVAASLIVARHVHGATALRANTTCDRGYELQVLAVLPLEIRLSGR